MTHDDGGPRAREMAVSVAAFNAFVGVLWERWRPYLIWIVGAVALTYLALQQLFTWAAVVAALFFCGWLQNTPAVQRWLRHVIVGLRLRLIPPAGVYIDWRTPARDADHEVARAEFARVMTQLHSLPRDVDGDGRVERRKWLYAATEQADGLMIRGDDPFYAIRTRPQRGAASAPAPVLGFVGAAAASGVVSRWRLLVMVALGAAAALLYARGEVLEAERDSARADQARAEERAMAADQHRIAAEQDLREYIDVNDANIRRVLEENRISRDFLEEQDARRRRLEQRRAERERQIQADTPEPVDLSGSLRDLAAPAASAVPPLPAPEAGGDTPG